MRAASRSSIFVVAVLVAACSRSEPPEKKAYESAQQSTPATGAPAPAAATSAAGPVVAPAGHYALDRNHASLHFKVHHLGLSNYVIRFTSFDAHLMFDPANAANSSVTVNVDPTSVRTDYPGDYKAGHKTSPYTNWDEDLAQSPKFLNAGEHKQIAFKSTRVEQAGPGKYKVMGDLTMLGQTHPLTLDATVTGSLDKHPMNGRGSIAFSATGTFNRSTFGVTHLLQPLLVSDAVTIQFEGEFHQAEDAAAPATPETPAATPAPEAPATPAAPPGG